MRTLLTVLRSSGHLALVLLSLPLVGHAEQNEQRIPRFICTLNRSEAIKVYEVLTPSGRREVAITIDHFLKGENEKFRLMRPEIVEYDRTYLVLENRGRSGYLLLRFEEIQNATDQSPGEVLGLMDNKLFNPAGSGGPLTGFQTLSHCRKL